jgi:hypothetical protein
MASAIEHNIADNDYEGALKKLGRVVRDATERDPRGIINSELTRRCQSIDARKRRDIVDSLQEAGQIDIQLLADTGGRPARWFKWIGE